MAFIEWDKKLSVGVSEFDEEHKKLIVMINSLHDAMKSGKGKELLAKILDEVTEYALKHFAHEEKLMVQYRYPEHKEHKAAHDHFVKTVVELRKQHDQQLLQAGKLLKLLQDWLVSHINNIDKKYSLFFMEAMKK